MDSGIYAHLAERFLGDHSRRYAMTECGHGAVGSSRFTRLAQARRCWTRPGPVSWQGHGREAQVLEHGADDLGIVFEAEDVLEVDTLPTRAPMVVVAHSFTKNFCPLFVSFFPSRNG